jgi:hypothetical protein
MDRRGFLSLTGLTVASTVATVGTVGAADAQTVGRIRPREVIVTLDKARYRQGEVMTLVMRETISSRAVRVTDSSGAVWTRQYNDKDRCVYTAFAGDQVDNEVTVEVRRRRDGAIASRTVPYAVKLRPGGSTDGGRWPGHQPGKVLLGLSTADLSASIAAVGPVGLRRTFYNWADPGEDKAIRSDHAAGRLPWISFKPPGGTSGWAAIASGQYDSDIKAMANRYAGYPKPLIATFHHEPTNDGGDPGQYAAAWLRIHDVMAAEAGLANVAFAPILGDWEFNPKNRDGRPDAYLTPAVLDRIPFLGVDLYQNASNGGYAERLERIVDWLDFRGVPDPMVGIGETGCCLAEDPRPEAWLQANWDWAVANVDRIGAMSYFDSTRNSRDGHIWSLSETTPKTNTFKSLLASATATTLG